jgi:protein SCO1/2
MSSTLSLEFRVQNRYLVWGLAAAFAVLVGITAGMLMFDPGNTELKTGTLLKTPRTIADFTLQGADGKPFTKANLSGHWTLVFAGYTYCPDVCPTTLTEMKALRGKLGAEAERLQITFISIDPERDTPEKLDKYVHYFSPDFTAATADPAVLEKLGSSLGFVFTKVPGGTADAYLMDHSAGLILIDPQARVAGYFSPPFQLDAMAQDLVPLLKRGS